MNGNIATDEHVNAVVYGHAATQAEYAHTGYERHYVAHVSPPVWVLRVGFLIVKRFLFIRVQF